MLVVVAILAAPLALVVGSSVTAPPAYAAVSPDLPLAVGSDHSCAITASAGLACWGDNDFGQLGDGTTQRALVPVTVPGLSGVRSVVAGLNHTCALTSADQVWCWGLGTTGQLGNGATTSVASPTLVTAAGTGIKAIGAGDTQTCVVTGTGAVNCWGRQIGSPVPSSTVPVEVDGMGGAATAVTGGTGFACALLDTGIVRCWGLGTTGQLGRGSTTSSATPVTVSGLTTVTSIDAGSRHACAILADASARCWGRNNGGSLGNGNSTNSTVPVVVTVATGLVAVTAVSTDGYTCAIRLNGSLVCWGFKVFTGESASSGLRAVSGSAGHLCAMTYAGGITCWGGNDSGQLGNGGSEFVPDPYPVPGLTTGVAAVGAGVAHTCALAAGAVRCWGSNTSGQLGNGTTTSSITPVTVTGLPPVKALSVGGFHACAVTVNGETWCWGRNTAGQLGNGTTTQSSAPVPVTGLSSGTATVASGNAHTCALSDLGGVTCWGAAAQIGTGATAISTAPVPVPGLTSGATAISAGLNATCASTAAGATCWGNNLNSQLGAPSAGTGLPVTMIGLTSPPTAIAASAASRTWLSADVTYYGHTCVVDAGAARCVGNNHNGQLGDGTTTQRSILTSVTGLTSGVTAIAASIVRTCAVVAGGVQCWGSGSTTPVPVPGIISGATAVTMNGTVQVLFGNGVFSGHTCALVDAGVQCWGANDSGQSGLSPMSSSVVGGNVFASAAVPPPTIVGSRTPVANGAGWVNSPVTVSFTCGSPILVSCSAPVTVSTDGTDQTVTGSVSDEQGRSDSAVISGISIDRIAPTLSGLATAPPNAAGWYKVPVRMAWTCSDDRSGIVAGTCPADAVTVGEGSAVSVSSSVTDRAGNSTTASSESVRIDRTAPSTGVSSPPTWSNEDVILTLSPTDALSGVASTSYSVDGAAPQSGTTVVVSGEGTHTVSVWSTDVAGNVEAASSVTVRIDVSAPSITKSVSPAPNGNGWNRGPVDVTFTCTDTGGSAVATCTGGQSFTGEVDTVVTGNAADVAGNTASVQATVRIDLTAPTVTAQVPPANGYGWFNTPVQVPFSCTDTGGSGVATCPVAQMFAGEGADQTVTALGQDNAGNIGTATGATVSLDTTAPTITGEVLETANPSGGYAGTAHVRFTCNDTLSGVVACPADQTVSGEGVHVIGGSVTDRAGNTASTEVTLSIDHDTSTDPGTVHGTITDAVTGLPAAGVLVRLHHPSTVATVYSTTTGTDGSYVFPLVADGSYRLSLTKWGTYLQGFYPNRTDFAFADNLTIARGTNLILNQAMSPGHVLQGTLTSSATGLPVSGATVQLSTGVWTISDATGRYEFKGQATSTVGVQYIAYGYGLATATAALPAVNSMNKALTPSGESPGIKGTVTGPGGPVSGASVAVWVLNARAPAVTVATNAQGRYALPSVPPGTYQVEVTKPSNRRWAPGVAARSAGSVTTITTACTSTPDLSHGDVCATAINSTMP